MCALAVVVQHWSSGQNFKRCEELKADLAWMNSILVAWFLSGGLISAGKRRHYWRLLPRVEVSGNTVSTQRETFGMAGSEPKRLSRHSSKLRKSEREVGRGAIWCLEVSPCLPLPSWSIEPLMWNVGEPLCWMQCLFWSIRWANMVIYWMSKESFNLHFLNTRIN